MRRPAWLALTLATVLALPAAAHADKSYTLPRAMVSVTLARSGEVLVREDLTFSYSGYFTGAYRDIPLAKDVEVVLQDVQVSEGGQAVRAGREHDARQQRRRGRFGAVRLPQGLRIVWHYSQSGGQRTYTLRYRLRGVVMAYDDAVEVAPQVWGNQWQSGLAHLFANVHAAGACPGHAAGWSRPGSTTA